LSVRFGLAAIGHDGIVPTLHVRDGGSDTVTCCGIRTSCTVVRFVESESMRPAVIHGLAIVGSDAGGARVRQGWGWVDSSGGLSSGNRSGGVGAMETGLAGG